MRNYLLLIILLPFCAQAQEQYLAADLESWISVGIKKKLSDHVDVSLSEQVRLEKNSGQLQQLFTNLELDIKPTDFLYFGLGYRIVSKKDHDDDLFKHGGRYNIDIGAKHNVGDRFDFNYRFRFQRYKQFESNVNPSTTPVRTIDSYYPTNYYILGANFTFNL